MARLDVYPMPGKRRGGYVVDVQAELLSRLATRMVVPLIPVSDAPPPISELNPLIEIKDVPHVLLTQALASVPVSELRKPVCSIDHHHDAITRALDVLFVGF
ncbi:plasmid maintenance protein CcdB [Gluconobacter thailandicus]|uniref:CcdB family protein n=1 Tax=Gluconobacter thailandicus TaxID=257438 RepID=UPI000777247C|nr:CcdB family protein [Gluconobacter thailandicus]KXV36025.1 plasmid maintenance protein CcdB [Gluconobacter thailandicus]